MEAFRLTLSTERGSQRRFRDSEPAFGVWCGDASLTVRADPSISPGGCLLRAEDALLDATVQTRIIRTLAAVGIEAAQAAAIAEAAVGQDPDEPA